MLEAWEPGQSGGIRLKSDPDIRVDLLGTTFKAWVVGNLGTIAETVVLAVATQAAERFAADRLMLKQFATVKPAPVDAPADPVAAVVAVPAQVEPAA